MNKEVIYLVLIYLLIVGVSVLRIAVEETSYVSPDSEFYLKVSENIVERGEPVVPNKYPFDEAIADVHFSLWPLGYPLSIVLLKSLTGLDWLWASKTVNFIALACIACLLFGKVKQSWFVFLGFMSFTSLEVVSYTWSEWSFIACLFWLAILIHEYVSTHKVAIVSFSICLIFLFLIRYVGVLFLIVPPLLAVRHYIIKKEIVVEWMYVFLVSSISMLAYLYWNSMYSEYATGSKRLFPNNVGILGYVQMFAKSVFDELCIIKNYRIGSTTNWLFFGAVSLQSVLVGYCWFVTKKQTIRIRLVGLSSILLSLSLFYLVGLVLLRAIMPFDGLDYRLLSPFSVLALASILISISNNKVLFKYVKIPITTFLILSLLVNLPKHFLITYFF